MNYDESHVLVANMELESARCEIRISCLNAASGLLISTIMGYMVLFGTDSNRYFALLYGYVGIGLFVQSMYMYAKTMSCIRSIEGTSNEVLSPNSDSPIPVEIRSSSNYE